MIYPVDSVILFLNDWGLAFYLSRWSDGDQNPKGSGFETQPDQGFSLSSCGFISLPWANTQMGQLGNLLRTATYPIQQLSVDGQIRCENARANADLFCPFFWNQEVFDNVGFRERISVNGASEKKKKITTKNSGRLQ